MIVFGGLRKVDFCWIVMFSDNYRQCLECRKSGNVGGVCSSVDEHLVLFFRFLFGGPGSLLSTET